MGAMRNIKKGICDRYDVLDGKSEKRIAAGIQRLEKRFPQVGFTVLIDNVKPEIPLHLFSFWIFNRSNICASVATGGVNRDILLVIDVRGRRSSLMIGYGLEPFLSAQHLTEVIEEARAPMVEGDFGTAALIVIEKMMDLLAALHGTLRRTYGAEEVELGIAKPSKQLVGPKGETIF